MAYRLLTVLVRREILAKRPNRSLEIAFATQLMARSGGGVSYGVGQWVGTVTARGGRMSERNERACHKGKREILSGRSSLPRFIAHYVVSEVGIRYFILVAKIVGGWLIVVVWILEYSVSFPFQSLSDIYQSFSRSCWTKEPTKHHN